MKISFRNKVILLLIKFLKKFNIPKKNHPEKEKKILIVSTTGVGDTLWGTPAIKAIKTKYPNATLSAFVSPLASDILKENPHIDDYLILYKGLKIIYSFIRLISSFKKKKFDSILIFHNSERLVTILCYFSGATKIVGINRHAKEFSFLLTHGLDLPLVHPIDQRLKMAALLGAPPCGSLLEMYLNKDERIQAKNFITPYKKKDHLLIAFQPGAQHPFKQWPFSYFIELGKKLSKDFSCQILITGSKNEINLANTIAKNIPNCIVSCGKLPLRVSAALLKEVDLLISNDTGPMHLAFALKVPVVALFSPTGSGLCGPYVKAPKVRIVEKEKTCKRCVRHRCYNSYCMQRLPVEEVFSKAKELLKD